MSSVEGADIKGYIIYREETPEELAKRQEEEAKLKELIKQTQGENADGLLETPVDQEDEGTVNEQTAAIIRKFKGKTLKEFIPHFLLN